MWSQRMLPEAFRWLMGCCWRSRRSCQRHCSTPCSFVCSPKSMMTHTKCISSWPDLFMSHIRKRWSLIGNLIILHQPSSGARHPLKGPRYQSGVIMSLGELASSCVTLPPPSHTHSWHAALIIKVRDGAKLQGDLLYEAFIRPRAVK